MTFDDARRAVEVALAGAWRSGRLATDADGYEDAESYLVAYGDARYIEGGDIAYMTLDAPAAFVSKGTGAVALVPYLDAAGRIDGMKPAA